MIEKPEFTGVNEDFEIIFNDAGAEIMNRTKVFNDHTCLPDNPLEQIIQAQQG